MIKQDWGNSRWDFTKSQSNWHFDPSKKTHDYNEDYQEICTFDGDWKEAVNECLGRVVTSTWAITKQS